MKVSYEYEYEGRVYKCPFEATVWDHTNINMTPRLTTVIAVVEGAICPFITVELDETGQASGWRNCEPLPEPKVKPWTPEKVPSGIEIYHPSWVSGARALVLDVNKSGICYYDANEDEITGLTFSELVKWGWKIYGTDEPCGEAVS